MRFTTEQQMLALSLASYRGFADMATWFIGRATVRESIERALEDWAPLQDWTLGWGPAIHQTPFTLFDDDVVFVAKHRSEPRYAIVIRGTNPVDLLDWVLGDFQVGNLLGWPLDAHGIPRVEISVSAYRGLMYLLNMQAGSRLDRAWDAVAGRIVDPARSALRLPFRVLDPVLEQVLRHAETTANAFEDRTVRRRVRGREDEERWGTMAASWSRHPAGRPTSPPPMRSRLDGLWDWASLVAIEAGVVPQRARPGVTLVEYLSTELTTIDAADVIVTGHSKGGALAPVLALWLAQTQHGAPAETAALWDPAGKANVVCHAFAGPTPGNEGFARLYDHVLGDAGHRYANRVDVAPHAWAVEDDAGRLDLTTVERLYGGAIEQNRALRQLLGAIRSTVDDLAYAHPGRDVHVLPGRSRPGLDVASQMVHQHLPAYANLMGLRGSVDPFDLVD
jgi:hypothetical protein